VEKIIRKKIKDIIECIAYNRTRTKTKYSCDKYKYTNINIKEKTITFC
jgi:hypothetical protein